MLTLFFYILLLEVIDDAYFYIFCGFHWPSLFSQCWLELAFLGQPSFIYLLYNFHMFLLLPLLFPLRSVNLCFLIKKVLILYFTGDAGEMKDTCVWLICHLEGDILNNSQHLGTEAPSCLWVSLGLFSQLALV